MSTTDSFVRAALLVIAVVLLVPLLMMLFMLPLVGFGHMGWAGAGGTVWPWVFWAVAFLVVLGGGYLLYGAVADVNGEDAAMAELRSAYARGEIDTEEFEERHERLRRTE
jgi:putative membrane protein